MKRKIFTILSILSLSMMTACGVASDSPKAKPSPSETTSASTATDTERETTAATETGKETVEHTRTKTETATTTVTVPEPANPIPRPNTTPSACSAYEWWSNLEDSTSIHMVRGEIYDIRIGKHECFDRIVIDVDTKEDVGFHARYVDVATQFGSGHPVPVEGGAVLELVIDAPVRLSLYDNPPAAITKTPDWETLREVKNAGHFEGITKLVIGVDSQVKYGVYHHTGADGRKHVVVDLIHPFD